MTVINVVEVGKESSGINMWSREMTKRLPSEFEIVVSKDYAIDSSKVDLVYYNFYRRVKDIDKPSVSLFSHIEEYDPNMAERFFTAAEKVDHAIVMSRMYLDKLVERGIPEENISVASMGVDFNVFTPKIRLGIAARMHRSGRKGEKFISDFFKNTKLPREYFKLIITGRDWEGWVEDNKDVIDIDYRGFVTQEEVRDMMREIDYYFCPSAYEGECIPLIEALGCGKTLITRRVGVAVYEMVGDKSNIIYFDTADDLEKVFDNLIMSKRRIVEQFSWENYAKVHESVFRSTLQK